MRFLKYHLRGNVYYAAIDPGGGGGGIGGQPAGAPTPTPQPGSQGQGQGGGFREQFFQGVPDEVWGQVEPHVRNVQGHLTQLEQRYAPFKGYRDDDLQGLAAFSSRFNSDPVGQWILMAKGMQDAGVLNQDLDLQHLAALVKDELDDQAAGGGMPPNSQQPPQGDMPPWAQQLLQRLDRLEGGVNKFQTSHQQQVEDAVLKRQVASMKSAMKQGGIPDGAFSDEAILAAYIAHRGNSQAAAKSFVDARNTLLKGFVQDPNAQRPGTPKPAAQPNSDLELPNGAPQARVPRGRGGRKTGVIGKETAAAAAQYLKSQGVE